MRATICDNCKDQLQSPEHWQLEQVGDGAVFGRASGPFDFCSVDCLDRWTAGIIERRAQRSA